MELNNKVVNQKNKTNLVKEKNLIFEDMIKDNMQLNKTIIPPVNNKITAYLIQEFNSTRNAPPIKTLNMINQIIKKVGLSVNKQVTNPEQRKNKNKDIKINQRTGVFFLCKRNVIFILFLSCLMLNGYDPVIIKILEPYILLRGFELE